MENLTQAEINRRMIQWRNDRLLAVRRKERMQALEEENAELRATVSAQQRTIEKLLLRVEQLETMVFGRKKQPDDHDDRPPASPGSGTPEQPPRSAASFRRATPSPDEVTSQTHFPVDTCPDCGTSLRRKETIIRFVEDIPIAKKIVEEQYIGRGFCPCCKRIVTGIPIASQHCTLGPDIRLYILFAVTVLGQTFEKVRAHLHGLHDLDISDGEMANILREGHEKLLPAKKGIEDRLNAAPVAHYDETTYPVQHGEQGNYAWIRTSATGSETLFLLGRTGGKGNAEEIRGPPSDQVGMSDDYGAYDALFERHALCWAHPLRKFRDLARSGALTAKHHVRCLHFYERFHLLERAIALTIVAPLSPEERAIAAAKFGAEIAALMAPNPLDLLTLAKLKRTFLENREKYLLCIRLQGVPMTNNQAERRLRGLVIKRLLSFGSRTQKGAQAMETLFSVLLTLWWSKPKDYFGELRRLMAPV